MLLKRVGEIAFPCQTPERISKGVDSLPLTLTFFLSKQELCFVKENYEIFSTEVSAREKQGQNSGGPVVESNWVSWNFIRRSAILNLFAGWGVPEPQCSMYCFFIVQFLFLPSSCEVSLRKRIKKTPGKCRTS